MKFKVAMVKDEQGKLLFSFEDVCKALEIKNINKAKQAILEEFGKGDMFNITPLKTQSEVQNLSLINENELYFILNSNESDKSKLFKIWLNKKVLPQKSAQKQDYNAYKEPKGNQNNTTINLQVFSNENYQVRTTQNEQGEILFCLRDVCENLGLTSPHKVKDSIAREFNKGAEFDYYPLQTTGGVQNFIFINESELYFVLMRSDKPRAKQFRLWVNKEVLPSIRKTGQYQARVSERENDLLVRNTEIFNKQLEYLNQIICTQNTVMSNLKETIEVSRNAASALREATAVLRESMRLRLQLSNEGI